jgi:hypothetical protein
MISIDVIQSVLVQIVRPPPAATEKLEHESKWNVILFFRAAKVAKWSTGATAKG